MLLLRIEEKTKDNPHDSITLTTSKKRIKETRKKIAYVTYREQFAAPMEIGQP
jgi:hypothetical protein